MPHPPIGSHEKKQLQAFMRSEFNALIRKPERPVYHYAEGSAAARILDQGRLAATNILFVNDGEGLHHAVDTLHAVLDERRRMSSPDGVKVLDTIKTYLSHLSGDVLPDVWVVTVSEQRDCRAHWQSHGGAGRGVALGFSPEGLVRAVQKAGAVLLPCCYDDATQVGILSRAVALIERFYGERLSSTAEAGDSGEALIRAVMREVALFGALLKPADLVEEREWRIALLNATQTAAGARAINAVPLSEYMSLALDLPLTDTDDRLPLTEIIVGPGRYQQLTERAFRTLLYKNAYDDVPVTRSALG
jgi:hypothetical protein